MGTRRKLVKVLLGNAELAAVALEDEDEELDSGSATGAALLLP